jgi:hypothetical protein
MIVDTNKGWGLLAYQQSKFNGPGIKPRRTVYGSTEDRAPGLVPFDDTPYDLIDPLDYKEVIQHCHEKQIFAMYHQADSWAPPGFRWNQNGLNYCWFWSLTGCVMDKRAEEGKETKILSPVSGGWTVNWHNAGNYLEDGVKAAATRGICEMSFTPDPHSLRYRSYKEGWEDNALLYRIGQTWDTPSGGKFDTRLQYCISMLAAGASIYNAHYELSHAMTTIGVIWDESQYGNVRIVDRNSHNEDRPIEKVGPQCVADEQIGICSTLT